MDHGGGGGEPGDGFRQREKILKRYRREESERGGREGVNGGQVGGGDKN